MTSVMSVAHAQGKLHLHFVPWLNKSEVRNVWSSRPFHRFIIVFLETQFVSILSPSLSSPSSRKFFTTQDGYFPCCRNSIKALSMSLRALWYILHAWSWCVSLVINLITDQHMAYLPSPYMRHHLPRIFFADTTAWIHMHSFFCGHSGKITWSGSLSRRLFHFIKSAILSWLSSVRFDI